MHLKSLLLKNFRNYRDQQVQLHSNFNFIFGKNAQGKTNLLEAIYYLGYLKSFRTSTRDHLLSRGGSTAVIEADVDIPPISHQIRILFEAKKREVWLNKKRPQLFRDYYGLVPILLFEPGEVYLFRESPSQRRRFMNQAVFLDYPPSLKTLRAYDEVLAQKNRILKEGGGSVALEIWNEQLVQLGARIIRQRIEWIQKMSGEMEGEYRNLSLGGEKVMIRYDSSVPVLDKEMSEEKILEALRLTVREKEGEEKRRGESVVGPHRDDFSLIIDDRSVGEFGSQGENRSAIIALKLSQIKLYEKEHQKTPIFLLDDVVSELDLGRTQGLFSTLQTTPGQVLITATEKSKLLSNFKEKGAYFLVEAGEVRVLG
ncbi:MAG: DNA replication/repair protein RecF [Deltaproteobacteria bacterium]|nr:DNA replication/repair protein RecF [Deltaproteobacteria bacterium]